MRPWYAFYPSDYQRDTKFLSPMADLVYRRLLDLYWMHQGPIPLNYAAIGRAIGLDTRVVKRYLHGELSEFWDTSNVSLINTRMDKEIEKSTIIQESRQKAGKAGGKASAKAKAKAKGGAKRQAPQPQPQCLSNDKHIKAPDVAGLDWQAFAKYIQYRKEAKIKKLTTQGEKLAAKKLVKFGGWEHQMEVVNQTISNGWTGLFELSGGTNHGTRKQSSGEIFEQGTKDAYDEEATSP